MNRSLSWTIPSVLTEVDTICLEVRNHLEKKGLNRYFFSIDLLLREFINNAIIHGNLRDRDKKVTVKVMVGKKWIRLFVSDQGKGFDWRAKKKTVPETSDISGRGLVIGAQYAWKMRYNRCGNQVALWIRIEGDRENDRV